MADNGSSSLRRKIVPWSEIVAMIAVRKGGMKWATRWLTEHFPDQKEAAQMASDVIVELARMREESKACIFYHACGFWLDDSLLEFLIASGRCPRKEL